jgi:type I restriction enzyme S subunit
LNGQNKESSNKDVQDGQDKESSKENSSCKSCSSLLNRTGDEFVNKDIQDGQDGCIESWPMVKLGDVSDNFQYGSSKKSVDSGKIICLRMGNIQNGIIDWSDLKYAPEDEELDKYLLRDNDVLFNRTNSPVHVGKTAIFKGDQKVVFAGYLIRIQYKKESIIGDYLNYCLNSREAKDFCQKVKTDGINQSNINAQVLATFKLSLPPIEAQQRIVAKIEAERKAVDGCRELIKTYEEKIKRVIDKVWEE